MNIEGSVNQGHFEKNVWVVTLSVEYYGQRFEQSVENTLNISKRITSCGLLLLHLSIVSSNNHLFGRVT